MYIATAVILMAAALSAFALQWAEAFVMLFTVGLVSLEIGITQKHVMKHARAILARMDRSKAQQENVLKVEVARLQDTLLNEQRNHHKLLMRALRR